MRVLSSDNPRDIKDIISSRLGTNLFPNDRYTGFNGDKNLRYGNIT
jgi:hypothetical protein